jgi:hypothetical protein
MDRYIQQDLRLNVGVTELDACHRNVLTQSDVAALSQAVLLLAGIFARSG